MNKSLAVIACMAAFATAAAAIPPSSASDRAPASTAWQTGSFHVETQGVVGRSNLVLQRPNTALTEAMPLGNGRLGLGVWAENGYTAQLNRGDTFPNRLSAGHIVVPGLARLTGAHDYAAHLDLYNGEFVETGGGMRAITYVDASADVMVIEVSGADPSTTQTATLELWAPRKPQASAAGALGTLEETWQDKSESGATGKTFGSLAALTVDASQPSVAVDGPLAVKATFHPRPGGSFTIYIAAPTWKGGNAASTAKTLLASARRLTIEEHRAWWHRFWQGASLMKLSSADGTAEYFENLRMMDLFTTAAESRDHFPGSQAGIGDFFSSMKDQHQWGPSGYWHWNLRMQIAANMGAGLTAMNEPYFRLYRENLASIEQWTKQQMGGRPGICLPETMRFSGQGYENESWLKEPGINCSELSKPYYNARTLSTGAEVGLRVWEQYLYTDDRSFLRENYPLMREAARFLLAYAQHDPQGGLHIFPSNAHETNWDVHDPTTDVAAMRAFFPVAVQAASILGVDADLRSQLEAAIRVLPELPRQEVGVTKTLAKDAPSDAKTIIANSYDPAAEAHNDENIGLEPAWPYGLVGDDGPLHAVAITTFKNRTNHNKHDWSADPEQAARLGLAEEMKASLLALTESYQAYPSGLAAFMGPEFYVEQIGVLADAVQNALVQDYDGTLRIAPAWPSGWNADGTVSIPHQGHVHVQLHEGKISTLVIEAGTGKSLRLRNPWPGQAVRVTDATGGRPLVQSSSGPLVEWQMTPQHAYQVAPLNSPGPRPFAPVTGTAASAPKKLGTRTLGLPAR